jgi:hypothetical protein
MIFEAGLAAISCALTCGTINGHSLHSKRGRLVMTRPGRHGPGTNCSLVSAPTAKNASVRGREIVVGQEETARLSPRA